jgi:hypothetical protein
MTEPTSPVRFGFKFADRYRRPARVFGITERNAWAEVADGQLHVRFGPWSFSTRLANIAEASITGPYRFIRTAGPAHLGLSDRGLTFATNGDSGAYFVFHEAVRGIEPTGWLRHPNLTLTVADPPALLRAVGAKPQAAS